MTKDRNIFKDINDCIKVKVRFGNGTILKSKGKDIVMVEIKRVFGILKKFKALVEKQTGKHMNYSKVDENAYWNLEEEKVKNKILIPMQQPQEEVEEVAGDLGTPLHLYTNKILPEFTPGQSLRLLMTNKKLYTNVGALEVDALHYKSLIESLLYLTTTQANHVCWKSSIKIHAETKSNSLWNS
ncbi:hypothetical protein CR513_61021, partial [Mucuna pruriens]